MNYMSEHCTGVRYAAREDRMADVRRAPRAVAATRTPNSFLLVLLPLLLCLVANLAILLLGL